MWCVFCLFSLRQLKDIRNQICFIYGRWWYSLLRSLKLINLSALISIHLAIIWCFCKFFFFSCYFVSQFYPLIYLVFYIVLLQHKNEKNSKTPKVTNKMLILYFFFISGVWKKLNANVLKFNIHCLLILFLLFNLPYWCQLESIFPLIFFL